MQKFKFQMKKIGGKLVAAATLGTASGMALAGGGGGPDLSSITTLFETYGPAVVALLIAYAVVRWSIKATGLVQPK
jgi:hypothetical protein